MTRSALIDRFSLEGRVAVVTGASSGLGQQLAAALCSVGARVVIAARREERLHDLAEQLRAQGGECLPVACDVVRQEDVDTLVGRTLDVFGQVDVLVNNAGITILGPAEEEDPATFQQVLDVNLGGVYACCQGFGRAMLARESGSIVNVASVLGLVGSGQIPQAAYVASKSAVVGLTRELAAQWARRGVRVNAIAPGWFGSEMTEEMFADERGTKWMRSRTPMGRAGRDGEFDGAVLFLASDAASFITGQTLAIDGGWSII